MSGFTEFENDLIINDQIIENKHYRKEISDEKYAQHKQTLQRWFEVGKERGLTYEGGELIWD